MGIRALFVMILAAGIGFPMGCAANADQLHIVVEASSNNMLKFKLSNNSKDRITIKAWQVPWTLSVPYPLAVSVHVLDSETNRPRVVEEAGMHANEILGDIVIEPGKSIIGEVDIESRFHDPEDDDGVSSYTVSWTYSLPICDLGKTYVNIGTAEGNGKSIKVIFQETRAIAAALRCDDQSR